MDTLTNMPVTTKYSCPYCLKKVLTQKIFHEHIGICKFVHTSAKEHRINTEAIEVLPSQHVLLQYILDLSTKYERLEEKVNQLQKTTFQLRKKNIDEYIKTISPASTLFSDWINKCIIDEKILNILFEKDIKECLRAIITQAIEEDTNTPFKSFIQRPQTIFIYDKDKEDPAILCWRTMTSEEISHLTRVLCHRINKKYMDWIRDNQESIETNKKMQDLSMIYLQKANGYSTTMDQRISEVKKAIISNIQVSLKNLE